MERMANYVIPEGAFVMIASPREELRRRLIARIGCKTGGIMEALGGADALAQLDSAPCQVLLLDRNLLDLNAEELVEILKIQRPDLSVILLKSAEDVVEGEPESSAGDEDAGRKGSLASGAEEITESFPEDFEAADISAEPLPGMLGTTPSMTRVFRLA